MKILVSLDNSFSFHINLNKNHAIGLYVFPVLVINCFSCSSWVANRLYHIFD